MAEKECKSCKEMIYEIELLRTELTELAKGYSQIAERLWLISHKKR